MGKPRKRVAYWDKDSLLESGIKPSDIDSTTQRLIDHFKATLKFVKSISENEKTYMQLFIATKGEAVDIAEAMDIELPTTYSYRSILIKKTHFKDTTLKTTNDDSEK